MNLLHDLNNLLATWHDSDIPPAACEELADVITTHRKPPITPTQREILARLAEGYTLAEVAEDQGVTYPTINWHITQMHRAYSTRATTVVIVAALRAGDLTLDDIHTEPWWGPEPTQTQRSVLQALADHGTNAAASKHLGLRPAQFSHHVRTLCDNAGVHKRADLVVRAYRRGWVS